MLIAPPLPLVAKPDSKERYPEFPTSVVPLLSKTDPDVPDEPAFDVDTVTEPVVALVLAPPKMDTEPPVWDAAVAAPASITTAPPVNALETPADNTTAPPAPLDPEPTRTLMAPPDPLAAEPVFSAK